MSTALLLNSIRSLWSYTYITPFNLIIQPYGLTKYLSPILCYNRI